MLAPSWRRTVIWLAVAAFIAGVDQYTKLVALQQLQPYEPLPVTSFFNWRLSFNRGAAFSLLGDASGWQRWLFVGFAVVISGVLLRWLHWHCPPFRWGRAGIALVLGGAVGNVIDRIWRDGLVVDFLDFHVGTWHWPTFNVADSAICVGVGLILLLSFRADADRDT